MEGCEWQVGTGRFGRIRRCGEPPDFVTKAFDSNGREREWDGKKVRTRLCKQHTKSLVEEEVMSRDMTMFQTRLTRLGDGKEFNLPRY